MRPLFFIKLIIALAVLTIGHAFAQDPASHLEKIVSTNSLDVAGKTPFHIKIAFQLYDLAGKSSDSGVIERWWAAPGESKTMVEAESFKALGSVPFDETLKIDPRERYFLQRLLDAELHPVPRLGTLMQSKLTEATRTFNTLELTCLAVLPANQADGSGRSPVTFCVDPKSDALRIDFENTVSTTTRNGLGSFHETQVSLGIELAYERRLTITGKITLLQAFDPSKSEVKLSVPAPESTAATAAGSSVIAGKIVNKVAPTYPAFAKASHISGVVVLHAIITKQGTIRDLFPLASPTPTLTQSAMDAVKQWTYMPYLLNGQPIDVETVIDVNFRFGS